MEAMGYIGTRVRQRRLALGLTLKQLSERTAISEGALSLIERDERTPLVDTAMKLAAGLETTAEELYSKEKTPRSADGRRRGTLTASTS